MSISARRRWTAAGWVPSRFPIGPRWSYDRRHVQRRQQVPGQRVERIGHGRRPDAFAPGRCGQRSVTPGGIATVSGNVANIDGAAFTLTVNWGTNQDTTSFPFAAGTTSFSVTHYYTDAPYTSFLQTYNIGLTVASADGRTPATASTSTTGVAVAPIPYIVTDTTSIQQGQDVSLSAPADPGENDDFSYEWSVTGGTNDDFTGNGPSFSFVPNYQADYHVVSLTVSDLGLRHRRGNERRAADDLLDDSRLGAAGVDIPARRARRW